VDGVKRSAAEALGHFNAVIFLPQMTRVIEGGPEERRRYLNLALAQVIPGYAQALTDYAQALSQRNALLKQLGERGGDPGQLSYWDTLLAQRGAFMIHARVLAVQEMEQSLIRLHDGCQAARKWRGWCTGRLRPAGILQWAIRAACRSNSRPHRYPGR